MSAWERAYGIPSEPEAIVVDDIDNIDPEDINRVLDSIWEGEEPAPLLLAFNEAGELDTLEHVQAEHEARAVEVLARHLWQRTTSPRPDTAQWNALGTSPGGKELCDYYRAEAIRVIRDMQNA
jgi:hypothetical protein